jgi:type IX secretion system substrate protein
MKLRNIYNVLFFLFSILQLNVYAQTQLGSDIDGVEALEASGSSLDISASGDRIVIGARHNDEAGDGTGQVRVYDWNGVDWEKTGESINGESAGESFGVAVSMSADGNRIAVGASSYGPFIGQVRLFDWDGSDWTQVGESISGEDNFDSSGESVSLSADGSTVAIGAPFNSDVGSVSGQVCVYSWSGTNWVKRGDDIEGLLEGDLTGWSVTLSADGSRLAVGEPANGVLMNATGRVRIFNWDGSSWVSAGLLSGINPQDKFGESISFSDDGNRVAIGAASHGANGYCEIYEFDGQDWTLIGQKIEGENLYDSFGYAVSLSADGNRVAVGTPFNDGNGNVSGHARIFDWDGQSWNQLGEDIDGEYSEDFSAGSLAISGDGNRVAIGAWSNDDNGENAGHVRVFDLETITAIENTYVADFTISPNPTTGIIEIRGFEEGLLSVQDIHGRILKKQSVPFDQINLTALPAGMYLLTLYTTKGTISKKLIKQ